jgi:cytochrome c
MRSLMSIVVMTMFLAPLSARAGDPQIGGELAQRWCTSCHTIGTAGDTKDAAPAFSVIAKRHGADDRWLRSWLTAPHLPMPDFNLSRQEIDDLVAYLASLPRN